MRCWHCFSAIYRALCGHRVVALSGLLYVASQANIAITLASLQPSIFSLQLAFTPDAFWQVIEMWGQPGVVLYRSHFRFDNFHPLTYGAFGFLLVSQTDLFSGARPWAYRAILLSLPVAGVFDLIENAAHLYLLGQPHGLQSIIIPISGTCSLIKWTVSLLFTVCVTIQLYRAIQRRGP